MATTSGLEISNKQPTLHLRNVIICPPFTPSTEPRPPQTRLFAPRSYRLRHRYQGVSAAWEKFPGDQCRTFSRRADCTRSSVSFRDTSFGRTICPENPQEAFPQDLLYILSAIAPVQ